MLIRMYPSNASHRKHEAELRRELPQQAAQFPPQLTTKGEVTVVRYVAKRLLISSIVLILVTIFTFTIVQLAPGGPEILMDETLSESDREALRESLGLNEPIPVQYIRWFMNLIQGNMGVSFSEKTAVSDMLIQRIPNTLLLSVTALILASLVGIPLGIYSAYRPNSPLDYGLSFISMVGLSVPAFWFAIVLIIAFSVNLGILPSSGMYSVGMERTLPDLMKHMLMPAFVSMLSPLAQIVRYTRSSVLEVLNLDYIRTAKAKGMTERRVLFFHALKNSLIPVITAIGLMLPHLVGGSVIVEKIFAWPGMGRLIADAAFKRDYPVVMGATFIVALIVIGVNLLIDIIYGFLNPKIRLE